jgi:hypothetical protein
MNPETDALLLYDTSGQLQPTGGSRNSLRTRLTVARVYTYILNGERGLNSPANRCLQTVSCANCTAG